LVLDEPKHPVPDEAITLARIQIAYTAYHLSFQNAVLAHSIMDLRGILKLESCLPLLELDNPMLHEARADNADFLHTPSVSRRTKIERPIYQAFSSVVLDRIKLINNAS
jgi:hypothetical protein